jgi:hypothetical protein
MPLLDVFLTMMWFFLWVLWVLWFFLLFRVIMDVFRSHDLGGWGKAGWLVFVIVLPFLGVFVYLIARGHKMADRDAAQAQAQDKGLLAQGDGVATILVPRRLPVITAAKADAYRAMAGIRAGHVV